MQSIEPGALRSTTRVQAGVDEAGLGPLLGPLTIGYSAFRVPVGASDLWQTLKPIVTSKPESDRRRLVVADSKLVFTRNPRGERRLEGTALAFLAQCAPERKVPASAQALLERIPADLRGSATLASEAWYPHLSPRLPARFESGALEVLAARLEREIRRNAIEVVACGLRVLPVAELNASFDATNNKSLTHWAQCAPVLVHLWNRFAHEELDVMVDRHGGRMRYAGLLARTFEGCDVTIVREEPSYSEYVVRSDVGVREHNSRVEESRAVAGSAKLENAVGHARHMRIAFAERAEGASFSVALASCLAKYARETCMHAFNAYFATLQPDLKPTAGYTTDGRRWIEDARPAIERSGLTQRELVRER